jgi:hypothetical protein
LSQPAGIHAPLGRNLVARLVAQSIVSQESRLSHASQKSPVAPTRDANQILTPIPKIAKTLLASSAFSARRTLALVIATHSRQATWHNPCRPTWTADPRPNGAKIAKHRQARLAASLRLALGESTPEPQKPGVLAGRTLSQNGSFQLNGGRQFLGQCVCVASAMQSIKGFCASELWKTGCCAASLGRNSKLSSSNSKLVRRCRQGAFAFPRNTGGRSWPYIIAPGCQS